MTVDWGTVTLGEAGAWVSGGTPSTSTDAYWGGEIPWMSSKSLTDFRVSDSDRRLTRLGAGNGTKLVSKDTILMVVRGMSLKSEFRMGITQREVALSQDLKGLIPRSDLDPNFLAYALQSRTETVLDMVDEAGHGTGRLQSDRLFSLELPLPPHDVQRAIAATLAALDDKIESDRRAIDKAQDLADVLFFAASGESRAIADVATITMGSSPKGETLNEAGEGTPFYQGTRDFGFRFPSLRIWTVNPIRGAKRNDTLMAVRAPVGELNRAASDCCIGRGVAALHSDSHPSILYYAMRASGSTWDKFQGEGTVFASVNKKDVHESEILWIKDDRAIRLEEELSALDLRIESLDAEIQNLTALRDSLLPELLSGRIRAATEGATT